MGILRIRDKNKGMALKQGDQTTLQFELYDANNEQLTLPNAGKVYLKQKGEIYLEEPITITSENIASFKITEVLPAGKYYLEFIVDNKVFPSQDIDTFQITSSVLGDNINIIEVNGVERVAERALALIEDDLQAIEGAELTRTQAELDRQAQEEARETAESQREANEGDRVLAEDEREATFASYGPTLDAKADKSYVDAELEKKANKKQVEWQILPLVNGWTSESSYWGNGLRFFKDTLNRVHIEGYADGSSSTDSAIGFLPVGYRPSRRVGAVFANSASRVEIFTSGRISVTPIGTTGFFSASFRAE